MPTKQQGNILTDAPCNYFKPKTKAMKNYFNLFSSDTVNWYLPLALLLASTLRPFLVAILALNPCLLDRFLLDGWNVRFMILDL